MAARDRATVSGLVRILAVGAALFMAIAIAQEWQTFRNGLWGPPPAVAGPAPGAPGAAEAAVRDLLSLVRHYYLTAGDPRFSDRMSAAPAVIEEVERDVRYLRRNGRAQDQTLISLKVEDASSLGESVWEFRTREYWVVRTRFLATGGPSDPTLAVVARGRYVVRQIEGRWRVESWEPLPEAAEAAADAGPLTAGGPSSTARDAASVPAGAGPAPAHDALPAGRR